MCLSYQRSDGLWMRLPWYSSAGINNTILTTGHHTLMTVPVTHCCQIFQAMNSYFLESENAWRYVPLV